MSERPLDIGIEKERRHWRRTGPSLGGAPTFSPRAGKEFCVRGGRASPAHHAHKTVLPGRTKLGSILVADGSAPWRGAGVLAPCIERVFGGRAAGFARRPPTKNSSPGKNQFKAQLQSNKLAHGTESAPVGCGVPSWPLGRGRARALSLTSVGAGLRPAPTVREPRCVVMPGRPGTPGLNGEKPPPGALYGRITGRESLRTAPNGHPANPLLVTRYSFYLIALARPKRPPPSPLNRYSLIVNRYSLAPP